MVGSFLVAIVTGTGALLLPASYQGRAPTPLEAAFTATSATTVTGLGVVDTQTFWTPLGQLVILTLIKLGGLGVMTFTSLLGLVILRRLGLTQRLDAAASTRAEGIGDLPRVLRALILYSTAVEASVALLLSLRFWLGAGMSPGQALWQGSSTRSPHSTTPGSRCSATTSWASSRTRSSACRSRRRSSWAAWACRSC